MQGAVSGTHGVWREHGGVDPCAPVALHSSKEVMVSDPNALESTRAPRLRAAPELNRGRDPGGGRDRAPRLDATARIQWRSVLAGHRPGAVLARVVRGDPLDLRRRAASALRRRALLLDAERVFLRTAARVAACAEHYRGQPSLGTWLAERIEEALDGLLSEDAGRDSAAEDPSACAALARPLGIAPAAAQRVLRRFNSLPGADRRAFFELVVTDRGFDTLGTRAVSVARRARGTLIAVLEAEGALDGGLQTGECVH